MSRSVLVTGGAGFIGSTIAAQLLASGDEVVAVDNLHPQVHTGRGRPPRLPADVTLIPMDVAHEGAWDALLHLHRPQVVIHLAAETGTGQSFRQATRHASVNVVGTTAMLDAMSRADHVPEHFVLASSRAVYGEGAWSAPDGSLRLPGIRSRAQLSAGTWDPTGDAGERLVFQPHDARTTPTRPTNVYAGTKLAQEHILSAWCAGTGAALSVLRLQNVYGPGQSLTNSYTGVLAFFARTAREKQAIPVYEDGRIGRDFVHVQDVAQALRSAVSRPPASGFRLVDIGSGVPTTIAEVAALVAQWEGAPEPVVTGQFREGDVRAAWADNTAAADELDYEPAWMLEKGIRDLLAWVREEIPTT